MTTTTTTKTPITPHDLLNREMFTRVLKVVGIRTPLEKIDAVVKALGKKALLSRRGLKPVVATSPTNAETGTKMILLNPDVFGDDVQRLAQKLPQSEEIARHLELKTITEALAPVEVEVKYENLTAHEVLSQLLPPGVEVPTAYETIGHIAHLNLRKEHDPYKHRIGQVLVDKFSNIRTVVNKTGTIETQFRTFPMEILAGEEEMNVEVKTHGLAFRFNFAEVYWNSRLSDEHEHLVNERFGKGDLVLDAFCGVGPFAVRAAKNKACVVHANDLNPKSFQYLVDNLKLNKVDYEVAATSDKSSSTIATTVEGVHGGTVVSGSHQNSTSTSSSSSLPPGVVPSPTVATTTTTTVKKTKKASNGGRVIAYNEDARAFLRRLLASPTCAPPPHPHRVHIVMNLPNDAHEFLDCLRGSLSAENWGTAEATTRLPLVHCYCFSSGKTEEERAEDVRVRIGKALEWELSRTALEVRLVRDVAPGKLMVCAHFELPREVGRGAVNPEDANGGIKRARID